MRFSRNLMGFIGFSAAENCVLLKKFTVTLKGLLNFSLFFDTLTINKSYICFFLYLSKKKKTENKLFCGLVNSCRVAQF